ncbi:Probable protein phosphatase 2C 62 [Striga hermonthica]|uniref:Protein phosphatase n=1 Tax=Striga hermonthica TaxID=68872 RepID=A0A9N7R2K0_STRHE|nr:Probable protein phosphatase 2C 62 [Striga hermonthica]
MADSCCRLLEFQSFFSNNNLRLISPSKPFHLSALIHTHNSRFSERRTCPPQITLLSKPKPFCSRFDVVSTHEHSDGSLLFRFGDPTEIAKNDEIKETQGDDEIETEDGVRPPSVVKVFDGDREAEVVIRTLDKQISSSGSTDLADHANSKSTAFSDNISIESPENIQLPVLVSSTENEVTSEVDNSILDKSPVNEVDTSEIKTNASVSSTPGAHAEHLENMGEGMSVASDDFNLDRDSGLTDMRSETIKNVTCEVPEEKNLQTESFITENGSESEIQNVTAGNGNGNEMNEAEAKFPAAEGGFVNEIFENGSESCLTGTTKVFKENVEVESIKESEEISEAPSYELMELGSTESATNSEDISMTNFVLSSGAALLPRPSKALTGGEDAYFVAGQTWFGVADGMSQWSLEGTNPGVHARELVKICEKTVSDCNGISINNPLELLKHSVAETHSPGSSTVLIAHFDGRALNVANIGNSGFIVLRKGSVWKSSSPMQYAFCFPLRIEKGDDPTSLAETYRVDLEEGDLILTATDGLLDNLYDEEISSIVMQSLAGDKKLEEIAKLLATKAQEIGESGCTRSPFADDARAAGFSEYIGGRLDDVAVIVSLVQRPS